MSTDQLVITGIGLKPKRESGTNERDQTDELIDQDIERHPAENDLRNPLPDAVNNYGDRHQRDGDITKAWDKIDNRVQAEALLQSRDPDQPVHHQGNQVKDRFDRTAWLSVFRWKDFPLDLACVRFHDAFW